MDVSFKSLGLGLSLALMSTGFAAAGENEFPIDPNVDGPIKVKWSLTASGGLVLAGQNASGTSLTVQHTKDGNQKGVERHPIFRVIDKHNKTHAQKILPSIEVIDNNEKGVALSMGEGQQDENWSLVVTPDNTLFLREQESFWNGWGFVRFYVLTADFVDNSGNAVPAGSEVCPESYIDATPQDVADRGGTKYQYAKDNIVVRSCDAISREGATDIPVL